MRFAMLAPCHDTGSLIPVDTAFDPGDGEVVVLPSRHDGHAPCGDGGVPRRVTDDMLDELTLRGPWDGVLVILGGPDRDVPDGDRSAHHGPDSTARQVAQRVRRILGPDVPVGTVDDARTDIADQLSESLAVLWTLRSIAIGPATGPTGL
ncbi:hypothetical protein [Haloechinothrix halophila]|uniref:hypothetical protein n=1 Tax=Haloechinothrix halophila TaxID=1069073 RepID=UPI00041CF209|nr:hypothetical protein [Haloechinothrix halophila]